MIAGVKLIPLVTHNDERGYFREILKSSQLPKFGQWSMSYMHSGTIKAWHWHSLQTDYWFVPSGTIKAVLTDLRINHNHILNHSDLEPEVEEFPECIEYFLGDNQNPTLLVIPPGVAHGLKVLQGPAVLMYITSEEYNPADEGRIPYDALGYDWMRHDIK